MNAKTMPVHDRHRDIVVTGASAGGIAPLREMLHVLPPDLPAAIFVVPHIGVSSHLAEVLGHRQPAAGAGRHARRRHPAGLCHRRRAGPAPACGWPLAIPLAGNVEAAD